MFQWVQNQIFCSIFHWVHSHIQTNGLVDGLFSCPLCLPFVLWNADWGGLLYLNEILLGWHTLVKNIRLPGHNMFNQRKNIFKIMKRMEVTI